MSSIDRVLSEIGPLDRGAMSAARERQDRLTKPRGSLGRLEELSIQVAGVSGQAVPSTGRKAIVVAAADHGVCAEGVSLYPQEVTAQMVHNFIGGGAAINALARHIGARVVVVDVGVATDVPPHPDLVSMRVAPGTANMARDPAMSRAQAISAVEAGIEIVEREAAKGLDIVGTGDMGIGNTTAASAIAAAITGEQVTVVTGRGTGIDDAQLCHKVAVIERALSVNRPDPADGLDVLAKVGGLEIGALAGVMLGAAARRIPVVIDGFISGAAALVAVQMAPQLGEHLIAAHLSAEPGHLAVLKHLGLKPVVSLDMRLGEGSGAAIAISIVEAATRLLAEMATFAEAGVSTAGEEDGR